MYQAEAFTRSVDAEDRVPINEGLFLRQCAVMLKARGGDSDGVHEHPICQESPSSKPREEDGRMTNSHCLLFFASMSFPRGTLL